MVRFPAFGVGGTALGLNVFGGNMPADADGVLFVQTPFAHAFAANVAKQFLRSVRFGVTDNHVRNKLLIGRIAFHVGATAEGNVLFCQQTANEFFFEQGKALKITSVVKRLGRNNEDVFFFHNITIQSP